jgi:hypothetical protein
MAFSKVAPINNHAPSGKPEATFVFNKNCQQKNMAKGKISPKKALSCGS